MTAVAHIGAIEEDFIETTFRATCSCGWAADTRPEREDADRDLRQHYAASRRDHEPSALTGNCLRCRKPRSRCCC